MGHFPIGGSFRGRNDPAPGSPAYEALIVVYKGKTITTCPICHGTGFEDCGDPCLLNMCLVCSGKGFTEK